ncbi:hypothetical protein XELAEV_18039536mg [Xenopus laevis]|uniref:Uncharacterized protein n=1 Tax=Xenopus laevis TaxID=8355 RepID=A0A974H802_XENLA|nr:hypothetical protein XELAEV_18039536mg [Xenopus laevis]
MISSRYFQTCTFILLHVYILYISFLHIHGNTVLFWVLDICCIFILEDSNISKNWMSEPNNCINEFLCEICRLILAIHCHNIFTFVQILIPFYILTESLSIVSS